MEDFCLCTRSMTYEHAQDVSLMACRSCRNGEHPQCASPNCPCALSSHTWQTSSQTAPDGTGAHGRTQISRRLRVVAINLAILAVVALGGGCGGACEGLNNVDNGKGTPGYTGPMFIIGVVLAIAALIAWAFSQSDDPAT